MRKLRADTSIPKSTRIAVIVQLSLVFWLMISSCVQPFMSEYWANQSKENLFQIVMGDSELLEHLSEPSEELLASLSRHKQRFETLPKNKQAELRAAYAKFQARPRRGMGESLSLVSHILLRDLSPYLQAWMFFSLITSFLLLLRIDGGQQAAWLLLLIGLLYSVHNWRHGLDEPKSPDTELFPTEEYLVKNYLLEPLSGSASEQRDQLMQGWHLFLVTEYAKEKPQVDDKETYTLQVEEGQWAFLLARLELWRKHQPPSFREQIRQRHSLLFLMSLCIWQLFFAFYVNRSEAMALS